MTERVTLKEAKHIAELIRKVISVIEDPKYTYREVIYTLYEIIRNYEEKGHDLMENTSIQKVAEFGGAVILIYYEDMIGHIRILNSRHIISNRYLRKADYIYAYWRKKRTSTKKRRRSH